MLAKAMVRVPIMFWMYWPRRERARSHRVVCISQNCGSKLACEGNGLGSEYVLDVPASSRASSLPQSRVHFTKLWEQACLRGQWPGLQICFGCTGLFASKLAPTKSSTPTKTVGASLLAKAMVRVPNMFWVYWPIREQVGMPPTRSNRCQPTQPALLPAPQPKAAACGDWRSSPPLPSTRSTAAGGRS